jgi:CHASE2 domain-containing sensor protein
VILGDDTGLNFAKERAALAGCQKQIQPTFVGWQPQKSIAQLQTEIRSALRDSEGWDVLLFFGHSNETDLTGGVISIAPEIHLQIQEIVEDLKIAKAQGLQFALFNSCSGLSIADSLIDLGLSQVAIMREAIHNHVAQEFLVQFLQNLADYKDAYHALRSTCEFLRLEQYFTYPSAYLIPSLFRHPAAEVFRLQPKPNWWKRAITPWRPSPVEAIALPVLLLLSCLLPLQDKLVAQRLLVQSIYRDFTGQIEPISTVAPPPVLLVQIDEASINKAKISQPRPMNRKYVALIVDRLGKLNAKVVGIDILFDRYAEDPQDDRQLAHSLRNAVSQHQTQFVLATFQENGEWLQANTAVASSNWSISGNVELLQWAMRLAPRDLSSTSPLPFSYVLAFLHRLNEKFPEEVPQPNWRSSQDFFSQLKQFAESAIGKDFTTLLSPLSRRQSLTLFSSKIYQRWLHPIIDFSIPPDRIYHRIPAWKLLESNANIPKLQGIQQQVVVLAAGGYGEAGLFKDGQDNFPLPPAVGYWRSRENPPDLREKLTGGESHAYMIHHLLRDRLVVPVPDLWAVGVAMLLGKGMVLVLSQTAGKKRTIACGGLVIVPLAYGVVSLHVYVSAAILFPWLLPSAAFWIYGIPIWLRRKKS